MAQHHDQSRRAQEESHLSRHVAGNAGAYQLGIRRDGRSVHITLTTGDEYASIELYEKLVGSAKEGCLRLDMNFAES